MHLLELTQFIDCVQTNPQDVHKSPLTHTCINSSTVSQRDLSRTLMISQCMLCLWLGAMSLPLSVHSSYLPLSLRWSYASHSYEALPQPCLQMLPLQDRESDGTGCNASTHLFLLTAAGSRWNSFCIFLAFFFFFKSVSASCFNIYSMR